MSGLGSNALLDGIIANAKAESAVILDRALAEESEIAQMYSLKIQEVKEAEHRAMQAQLDEILRREESAIRNAQRKSELQKGDHLWSLVMDCVSRKMGALIGQPSYQDVLVHWIAEATIGLDREAAVVRCSFKEQVTTEMLKAAQDLVLGKIGRKVTLTFNEEPLAAQGVVVSSVDGKVAYNNQVATRIGRYARELKDLMEVYTCKLE
jgi:vacuolar-type H+-ATPase subunit E/Vma4